MNGPVAAIAAISSGIGIAPVANPAIPAAPGGFATLLRTGIADLEARVAHADQMARAFVLDDRIPVHQVTLAMEQARMSLELMLQVRSRILESYQQIMGMQL